MSDEIITRAVEVRRFTPAQIPRRVVAVDPAISTKTSADRTAIGVLGQDIEGNIIILDVIAEQIEWPDARSLIVATALRYQVASIGFETVAFQLAAVQDMRRLPELTGIPVVGIPADRGGKGALAATWAPLLETDKFYMAYGDWNEGFLQEAEVFPKGRHEDRIDMIGIGVKLLKQHAGWESLGAKDYKPAPPRAGWDTKSGPKLW